MRQLHLVGFTSDHEGIILAGRRGSKTGGYVVTIDDEFLEQLDQARRTRVGLVVSESAAAQAGRSRVESALSPREMQTRMRAGRTVAQVAAEAGVPLEWVERFAAPVLAEQAAAVERAQSTTMRTQRRGHSDRPLGPSVLRNLADRGVRLADDEFDQLWTAFQLADNEWVIRFSHRWRGRDLDAEWLLDDAAGSLTPGNRQATELGFVDPGRHAPPVKGLPPMRVLRRPAPVVPVTAPSSPAASVGGEPSGTADKPARARKSAKPRKVSKRAKVVKRPRPAKKSKPATRAAVAKKAGAKKAGAKKAGAKKAGTKRAGTKRAGAATKASVTKKGVAKKTPAAKKARAAKKAGAGRKVAAPAKRARRPLKAKRLATSSSTPQVRRQRPLKAVRIDHNGTSHAGVRAGRVSSNGTGSRRAVSVPKAGGNGSRRSRG